MYKKVDQSEIGWSLRQFEHAQNHSFSPWEVVSGHYLPSSHEKLTESEIRSSYYLLQFNFIYPYLATKYHFCPYFTYIWSYLGIITLIWAYLPLIAQILPYVPYCMYYFIKTTPPCKILEQSDHYSLRYCISKNWGIQKCLSRMQFRC